MPPYRPWPGALSSRGSAKRALHPDRHATGVHGQTRAPPGAVTRPGRWASKGPAPGVGPLLLGLLALGGLGLWALGFRLGRPALGRLALALGGLLGRSGLGRLALAAGGSLLGGRR